MTCLAASVAATAIIATPAAAAPVGAGTPATAQARVVRPLSLAHNGTLLDFGVIVIPATGVTSLRTVSLSDANVRDCTTLGGGELTCGTDTTSVPTYTVTGTNGQVVRVIKTAGLLNGSNGGTLAFRPTGTNNVTLSSSGSANFTIGGQIDIVSGTTDGTYTGSIDVTVDY
jgi:hypothetical protein